MPPGSCWWYLGFPGLHKLVKIWGRYVIKPGLTAYKAYTLSPVQFSGLSNIFFLVQKYWPLKYSLKPFVMGILGPFLAVFRAYYWFCAHISLLFKILIWESGYRTQASYTQAKWQNLCALFLDPD